jgi:hypothetical protein
MVNKGRHTHTRTYHVNKDFYNKRLHFYLEQEHSKDEKKLLSLLQESQEEQEDLLNQQVKTKQHIF